MDDKNLQYKRELGLNIKHYRLKSNYTQEQLAEKIGIVLAVCLVGEGIAALLPIPFPASVISMVLLFLLLAAKLLRPHHIKEKSNFLITNMACFFVPAGVGILRYADVLWANLLPLLAICFITTPLVYGVTAWAVQLTMRAIQKKEARHD